MCRKIRIVVFPRGEEVMIREGPGLFCSLAWVVITYIYPWALCIPARVRGLNKMFKKTKTKHKNLKNVPN